MIVKYFQPGKRIAVGYEDGALRLFDLKSGTVSSTISTDFGHTSTITALDCHPDNNLLMSGAMDGKTILSMSHSGKVRSKKFSEQNYIDECHRFSRYSEFFKN